jgi:hypothetical protein
MRELGGSVAVHAAWRRWILLGAPAADERMAGIQVELCERIAERRRTAGAGQMMVSV